MRNVQLVALLAFPGPSSFLPGLSRAASWQASPGPVQTRVPLYNAQCAAVSTGGLSRAVQAAARSSPGTRAGVKGRREEAGAAVVRDELRDPGEAGHRSRSGHVAVAKTRRGRPDLREGLPGRREARREARRRARGEHQTRSRQRAGKAA
eukprot:11186928-Lingulodinium_polyedra.AAC.1